MSQPFPGTIQNLHVAELTVRELTASAFVNALAKSNGITLVGQGFPLIVAQTSQSKSNAAPTALSYTPPAVAGTYRASWYLDITTGTTLTFIAKLTYTDPAGSARSANIELLTEGGTSVVAGGPAANSTGQFSGVETFAIDNSATAITVVDNSGTYTTGAYRWVVVIEQLV